MSENVVQNAKNKSETPENTVSSENSKIKLQWTDIDQKDKDIIGMERLNDDNKLILDAYNELLEELSAPLRQVIEKAKTKTDGSKATPHDHFELFQVEKAVMKQLEDIEKDLMTKF